MTLEQLAHRFGLTLADVTERWSERAAIRQYDAGLSRADAERAALLDVEAELEGRRG